jgi:hypothetical protein
MREVRVDFWRENFGVPRETKAEVKWKRGFVLEVHPRKVMLFEFRDSLEADE